MKWLVFVFLLVAHGLVVQATVGVCSQMHLRIGYQFDFADPRLTLTQEQPVFLGEGVWGKVFLKLDAENRHLNGYSNGHFVEKTYRDRPQMLHDHRALQYLKSKLALSNLNIATAEVSSNKNSPLVMELSYHPGRTVQQIVEDPTVPEEIRIKVREEYARLLRQLFDFFQGEEFLVDLKKNELSRVSARDDSYGVDGLHFIIKPDNIIVDPVSLQMTLIDPS